jgi:hypothetical protein
VSKYEEFNKFAERKKRFDFFLEIAMLKMVGRKMRFGRGRKVLFFPKFNKDQKGILSE